MVHDCASIAGAAHAPGHQRAKFSAFQQASSKRRCNLGTLDPMLHSRMITAFAAAVLIVASAPARSAETATPNDTARFLAGLPPSPGSPLAALTNEAGWAQHAKFFDTTFGDLERRQFSPIREWSAANLTARRPVTFYMFSGPDFVYADSFFPKSQTYIMSGLEPTGRLPDILKLRRGSLTAELTRLRSALRSLLRLSYFITSEMGSDLGRSQLNGTLPVLYVFLARTGKTIKDVSFVTVTPDGKEQPAADSDPKGVPKGVKIVFSGSDDKPQTLYYFSTNLANDGVAKSGFLKFCESFGIGDSFVKSASYLLHGGGFSKVREFLLQNSAAIVQDDTGIPYRYYEASSWQVRPFGNYVGPIPVFSGQYQSKLKELFVKTKAPPISFGVGYRWRLNQSHVLLATKKDVKAEAPR